MNSFELCILYELGSNTIPNIMKVKAKVIRINKIVDEHYDRPFIPAFIVTEINPKAQVKNIRFILKLEEKKEDRE